MKQASHLAPFAGVILTLSVTSVMALLAVYQPVMMARAKDQVILASLSAGAAKVSNVSAKLSSADDMALRLLDRNRKALAYLKSTLTTNFGLTAASVASNTLSGAEIVNKGTIAVAAKTQLALTTTAADLGVGESSFKNKLLDLIALIDVGWQSMTRNLSDYKRVVLTNWHIFLARGEETVPDTPATASIKRDRIAAGIDQEAIKAEIEAELRAEFSEYLRAQPARPNFGNNQFANSGLVVLPASGSSTADANLKSYIKNSFSDEVTVNFDDDGKTGVVTPVFRNSAGSNYLFILTPMKQ